MNQDVATAMEHPTMKFEKVVAIFINTHPIALFRRIEGTSRGNVCA